MKHLNQVYWVFWLCAISLQCICRWKRPETLKKLSVFSVSQLAGSDTSLSKSFLKTSLSGLSLTYVYMGRTHTKWRAQNTFAESVQKHRVLQDLIYYSCLRFLSVLLSSWITLHFHTYWGCFTNMSEFVTILLGWVISKQGTEAQRDKGFPFSAVSGSPPFACRELLARGRGRLKKNLQLPGFPSQHGKRLLMKE